MIDKNSLEKRICFTLSDDLFADISFEAGFFSKQKALYEKNKFFVEWGRSIIQAVYAYHIYQNDQELPVDILKKKNNLSYQYFENEIYTTYKLKEFVIKGSAPKISYPEISSKLIVLIYKQHGFEATKNFLYPFIQKHQNSKKLNNEILIQQYAKQTNQKLAYETIYISGQGKQKLYRCRIHIGNQYVEAKAIGIDKAKSAAESLFLQKYNKRIQQISSTSKTIKKDTKLSEERKQQLTDVVKQLKLNGSFLSFEQMDEVLTHPSFRSMYPDQIPYNNAMMAYLGFLLLDMLTYEYCYQQSVMFSDQRRDLIQNNSIADCLSEKYLMYLLRSPSTTYSNLTNEMKTDVFLGISASYWINYLITKDEAISSCAKSFILTRLKLSELIGNSNYLSFAEKISSISGWDVKKSSKFSGQDPNRMLLFTATITISGDYWEQSGTETSYKESTALDLAAKNVLEKIIKYCDNPDVAASIQNKITKIQPTNGPVGVGPTTPPGTGGTGTGPKPQPPGTKTPGEVSFDRSDNILYICKGTVSCERKHHKVISATGILTSLEGKPVKIDVQYCTSCKMYFINQDTYIDYREKLGNLMGNFAFKNYTSAKGSGSGDWADKSILKLCGYNVDKKNNLSEEKRRFILKNMMIRNILPKYRIEEYLEFFIRMNQDDRDKIMAVRKWKADLNWVRDFNIDQQRHFWINEIKKVRKS